MKFSNVEDGVNTYAIAQTGNYLVERSGEWYYWLESTSPYENHGPFETAQAALVHYNGESDAYTLADCGLDSEGVAK